MKFLKIFLLFILSSVCLFSSVTLLKKVELKKGELQLQFNKPYNKKQIRHFALVKPYREVFDIKNTRLANRHVGKNLKSSRCRSLRVSQYKKNVVRVVIETGKSYACTPYRPLYSYKHYHIPLPKFRTRPLQSQAKKTYKKSHKKSKKRVKKYKQKKVYLTSSAKKRSSRYHKNELIVIDAGHGGHDTGAIAGGKKEKDLVLQIAKRLEKQLKRKGYSVYMTRKKDRFLKLPQRTRIADHKDAKVFISIHANSVPKRKRYKVHGVETFFLQTTRDAKSQRIAARENRAVLKGAGSRLSKKVIIDSVLNGPKIVQSNKLAIDVQRGMIANLRSRYRGVKDGGVRSAPFWVLVGASRPSILVEVGYISHPTERKRLFTPRYQELIAKGIAEGINRYLTNRKKEIDF
ncbi:MAG: N-acetylmuramoyl-L-alanine amidase [Epsilonproteobacteria bacterium (ex Lamellibrachia satsuma)]|nr:MAG: N-acetylmuramoyl-L-alanine amidase [Epsilonproteobacteria bacterium (ex Lamellibrachia satsuma)]